MLRNPVSRVNFYEDTLSAEDVGLDLADVARLMEPAGLSKVRRRFERGGMRAVVDVRAIGCGQRPSDRAC